MPHKQISRSCLRAHEATVYQAHANSCALVLTGLLIGRGLGFRESAVIAAESVPHIQQIIIDSPPDDLHLVVFADGDEIKFETLNCAAGAKRRAGTLQRQNKRYLTVNLSWVARFRQGADEKESKNEHIHQHLH